MDNERLIFGGTKLEPGLNGAPFSIFIGDVLLSEDRTNIWRFIAPSNCQMWNICLRCREKVQHHDEKMSVSATINGEEMGHVPFPENVLTYPDVIDVSRHTEIQLSLLRSNHVFFMPRVLDLWLLYCARCHA